MVCNLCSSLNQAEFKSEIMIHVSGLGHLADSGVLTFPKISICMDCGASRFSTSVEELRRLRGGLTVRLP